MRLIHSEQEAVTLRQCARKRARAYIVGNRLTEIKWINVFTKFLFERKFE